MNWVGVFICVVYTCINYYTFVHVSFIWHVNLFNNSLPCSVFGQLERYYKQHVELKRAFYFKC